MSKKSKAALEKHAEKRTLQKQQEEEMRLKKIEENKMKSEEARKAEEARKEETRKAEEAKLKADDARKAEEAKLKTDDARKAEEAKLKTDDARKAEEVKLKADDARKAEAAKLKADDARKAEAAKPVKVEAKPQTMPTTSEKTDKKTAAVQASTASDPKSTAVQPSAKEKAVKASDSQQSSTKSADVPPAVHKATETKLNSPKPTEATPAKKEPLVQEKVEAKPVSSQEKATPSHDQQPAPKPPTVAAHATADSSSSLFWLKFMGGIAVGLMLLFTIDVGVDMYDRLTKLEEASGKTAGTDAEGVAKKLAAFETSLLKFQESHKVESQPKTSQPVDLSGIENKIAGLEKNLQKLQESKVAVAPVTADTAAVAALQDKLSAAQTRLESLEKQLAGLSKLAAGKEETDKKLAAVESDLQSGKEEVNKKLVAVDSSLQQLKESVAKQATLAQEQAVAQIAAVRQDLQLVQKELDNKFSPTVAQIVAVQQEWQLVKKDLEKMATAPNKPGETAPVTASPLFALMQKDVEELKTKLPVLETTRRDLENLSKLLETKESGLERRLADLQQQLIKQGELGTTWSEAGKKSIEQLQAELGNIQKAGLSVKEQWDSLNAKLSLVENDSRVSLGNINKQLEQVQREAKDVAQNAVLEATKLSASTQKDVDSVKAQLATFEPLRKDVDAVAGVKTQVESLQKEWNNWQVLAKGQEANWQTLEQRAQKLEKQLQEGDATLFQRVSLVDEKLGKLQENLAAQPHKPDSSIPNDLTLKVTSSEERILKLQEAMAAQTAKLEALEKNMPKEKKGSEVAVAPVVATGSAITLSQLDEKLQKLLTNVISSDAPGVRVSFGKMELDVVEAQDSLSRAVVFPEKQFRDTPMVVAIVQGQPDWNIMVTDLSDKNGTVTFSRSRKKIEPGLYTVWWFAVGMGMN